MSTTQELIELLDEARDWLTSIDNDWTNALLDRIDLALAEALDAAQQPAPEVPNVPAEA